MSSTDEVLAAVTSEVWPQINISKKVFENQEEWIENLVRFVSKLDGVILIIRPHPREFPNKRESVTAEITHSRDRLFSNLPKNVIVDDPKNNFAIEDYFEHIQAITTGWSSIGLEWQMRGMPCVTYDSNLPIYPPRTHLTGTSRTEYFENLECALLQDRAITSSLSTFAKDLFTYSNFQGTIRVGSSIFDERISGDLLRRFKVSGALNRYLPRIKIWIDIHSPGIRVDKKKLIEYFKGRQHDLFD
jgi:hypothetical protein